MGTELSTGSDLLKPRRLHRGGRGFFLERARCRVRGAMMSKLPAPGAPFGHSAASANYGSVSRPEGDRIVLHLPHCNLCN